ncbi:acyl-CoA dehydrogenase family protein [Kribbella albertanoniae]|uniref:Acyl-CoA dehydrogenase n=1 Tax=Kribbella albertanoniae TaxID=1266829 RepID=A0A4R4QID4_9ACTN|nr:acyl-CoA dehydrogenase family protein [Kribbella albertanoniae]TDC35531.1 acyl-CoA dehydrogenase [Kribbella albertanoniae]
MIAERYRDAVATVTAVAEVHAAGNDRHAVFPKEALHELRETKLLGLLVPAEYGGPGGELDDLVDITIELGRHDLSVAMIFAMHCQQVRTLACCAGPRLRAQVLPAVAEGELYLASVTTEPSTGAQLLVSGSTTSLVAGQVVVDRMAPIVTGGSHADAFLITVRSPDGSPNQVDLVYATADQLTAEVTGTWDALGMRATESVPMHLAGAVPATQIVSSHQDYRSIVATVFAPVAHLGWAAAWLGTALGAYSRVIGHIRGPAGRRGFDPGSDLLKTRLATCRANLDVTHALLRHTARAIATDSDIARTGVQLLVNTLKTESAVRCFEVVHELVELAGLRHGYLPDSPLRLERSFRDLRSASLNFGNDRLRLVNGSLALMDTRSDLV